MSDSTNVKNAWTQICHPETKNDSSRQIVDHTQKWFIQANPGPYTKYILPGESWMIHQDNSSREILGIGLNAAGDSQKLPPLSPRLSVCIAQGMSINEFYWTWVEHDLLMEGLMHIFMKADFTLSFLTICTRPFSPTDVPTRQDESHSSVWLFSFQLNNKQIQCILQFHYKSQKYRKCILNFACKVAGIHTKYLFISLVNVMWMYCLAYE